MADEASAEAPPLPGRLVSVRRPKWAHNVCEPCEISGPEPDVPNTCPGCTMPLCKACADSPSPYQGVCPRCRRRQEIWSAVADLLASPEGTEALRTGLTSLEQLS